MVDIKTLHDIGRYFTIVHHVRGRIRLRADPAILKKNPELKNLDIKKISEQIDGINKVRINKLAATVIIEYDPDVIAPELWEKLIIGKDLEAVAEMINKQSARLQKSMASFPKGGE